MGTVQSPNRKHQTQFWPVWAGIAHFDPFFANVSIDKVYNNKPFVSYNKKRRSNCAKCFLGSVLYMWYGNLA